MLRNTIYLNCISQSNVPLRPDLNHYQNKLSSLLCPWNKLEKNFLMEKIMLTAAILGKIEFKKRKEMSQC